MVRPLIGRRSLALVLAASCAVHSSCGTILHPERIGQPPGRLDPGVVALDGVGLLLFLIPGAIAFAVDFYTGAIYLPPQYAKNDGTQSPGGELIAIKVDPQTLTPERIEQIVKEQTGHDIRLEPGSYSVARIDSIEQFDDSATRLASIDAPQPANAVTFRCQSE
jgi:hypothetical protein